MIKAEEKYNKIVESFNKQISIIQQSDDCILIEKMVMPFESSLTKLNESDDLLQNVLMDPVVAKVYYTLKDKSSIYTVIYKLSGYIWETKMASSPDKRVYTIFLYPD